MAEQHGRSTFRAAASLSSSACNHPSKLRNWAALVGFMCLQTCGWCMQFQHVQGEVEQVAAAAASFAKAQNLAWFALLDSEAGQGTPLGPHLGCWGRGCTQRTQITP